MKIAFYFKLHRSVIAAWSPGGTLGQPRAITSKRARMQRPLPRGVGALDRVPRRPHAVPVALVGECSIRAVSGYRRLGVTRAARRCLCLRQARRGPLDGCVASWFMMRGGSLQALKEILGYTDLKMTLRYAHLAPDHLPGEMMKTERSGNNIDPLQHKINADPVLAAAK